MEGGTKLSYRVIPRRERGLKRFYVGVLMWFLGRAIEAASCVDEEVQREIKRMPECVSIALGVLPRGPTITLTKDERGRFVLEKRRGVKSALSIYIKSVEIAFLVFTFREGVITAAIRNRLIVQGDLALAVAFIRILNVLLVYLLPAGVTRKLLKRYPRWEKGRKMMGRWRIFLHILFRI